MFPLFCLLPKFSQNLLRSHLLNFQQLQLTCVCEIALVCDIVLGTCSHCIRDDGAFAGTTVYAEGNSVLKLGANLTYPAQKANFFAPSDWLRLDQEDLDLGTAGI